MGRQSTSITCPPEDGKRVSKPEQKDQAHRLAGHDLLIMTGLHQPSKDQAELS
jgi:hypothetical protein